MDKELILEEFMPYRLSVLSHTISTTIAKTYEKRFGISIPEWRVIAILGRFPGLSAVEVADLYQGGDRLQLRVELRGAELERLVALPALRRDAAQRDGQIHDTHAREHDRDRKGAHGNPDLVALNDAMSPVALSILRFSVSEFVA